MKFIRDIIKEKQQATGEVDVICPPLARDIADTARSVSRDAVGEAGAADPQMDKGQKPQKPRYSLLVLPVESPDAGSGEDPEPKPRSGPEPHEDLHNADAGYLDETEEKVPEEDAPREDALAPDPMATAAQPDAEPAHASGTEDDVGFDLLEEDAGEETDEGTDPVESLFSAPVEEPVTEEPPKAALAELPVAPSIAPSPALNEDLPQPFPAEGMNVPSPSPGRAARRAGRVKTRLLGFGAPQAEVNDPMAAAAQASTTTEQFPVGWMAVTDGPGRGAVITLFDGVSQIGRGEDQAVRLDFGDTSISRSNHAAMAYDAEQRTFFVGHGGKANLVRLNDRPVLSTEAMQSGDRLRIGETTLRFVALCGADFDWSGDGSAQTDRVQHG